MIHHKGQFLAAFGAECVLHMHTQFRVARRWRNAEDFRPDDARQTLLNHQNLQEDIAGGLRIGGVQGDGALLQAGG